MSPSIFSLIFLLLTLFLNLSYSQVCNPNDKIVLLRIKKHWGNPPSLAHWDPKVDCCQWDLIGCDDNGRVTKLGIDYAPDIHGPIPPYLDHLPSLTDLSFNSTFNLTGPIPAYIGKLTNLTSLTISGTIIGGPIPSFLAQLTNLVQLDLSRNNHIGLIPDFLGQLKNLNTLDFFLNKLTGPIPSTLGQLLSLDTLRLSNNKLSGIIPDFTNLKNLSILDISFNQVSGPIPASLGFLPKLTPLFLQNNHLSGPIPKSLGRSGIQSISLEHNKLSGDASFLFDKNNTGVFYINVSDNMLKFDISKVDLVRSLTYVDISHNKIFGSLPLGFGLLDPRNFNVSYNQLCGPIPNGRRFKNVDTSIFAHNKCLCGGPFRACK